MPWKRQHILQPENKKPVYPSLAELKNPMQADLQDG
jgi:hypothetical protein